MFIELAHTVDTAHGCCGWTVPCTYTHAGCYAMMVWGGGMSPFLKRAHAVEICMQWMWWGGADVITVRKLFLTVDAGGDPWTCKHDHGGCYAMDGVGGGGYVEVHWTCKHGRCYALDGVGWGDVSVPWCCHIVDATQWMVWLGAKCMRIELGRMVDGMVWGGC